MKKLLVFFAFVLLLSSCGKDGVNGSNGINGTNGTNGQDGSDAAVEMIKLCPDIEEQYPSQFPEYALCVNNQLYAVYYHSSGSFLAKLLPGMYKTTTNGINCTFEIVENSCDVVSY